LHGLHGVVLETVRMGGTTYTSAEAVFRFLAKLNAGDATAISFASKNRREMAQAEERLDRAGLTENGGRK
jgi:hypothetical protein